MNLRKMVALGLVATLPAVWLVNNGRDAPVDATATVSASFASDPALGSQTQADTWVDAKAVDVKAAVESPSFAGQPISDHAWQQPDVAQNMPLAAGAKPAPVSRRTTESREPAPMSAALAAIALSGGPERVDIIVSYDALPSAFELGQLDARVQRDFPRLGLAQLSVPASALNAFAVQEGVSMLALDEPLGAASSSAKVTAAKPAPNSLWDIPVASDVSVAVLDSGVADLAEINVLARMDCTAGWQGSTRNYADHFPDRVFGNNDGTDTFSTPWRETGESDGVTSGALEIGSAYGVCLSGYCMEVEAHRNGAAFVRSVDLAGASEATLSYVYSVNAGNGSVAVEISADGISWHTLASYSLASARDDLSASFDITPFASGATQLRVRIAQSAADYGVLGIDNVRIDASTPAESCVAAAPPTTIASGNMRDTFTTRSYANNNGSLSFGSDWLEVGESDGTGTGDLEVDNDSGLCVSGYCMQIETGSVDDALVRAVNLHGVSSATVDYVYSHTSGGAVSFEASPDGGATWTTLATHDMSTHRDDVAVSLDLTPYATEDTQLRFRVTDAGSWGKAGFDNIEVRTLAASVEAFDQFGHGTHVAGIIGGVESGIVAGDGGVAPNAGIVSVRVLDGEGRGVTSDVIAGLDWVLTNAASQNIRVVNLSLGKAVTESATTDPLVAAAEAVWDAGIVVVTSAGNYGRDGHFTITSPGNSPKLITVGSLTDAETDAFSDDYISTYSSRGPTAFDHYLKPDLVAPGNRIVSATSGKSGLYKDLPNQRSGHNRLELSGTSMAAAMTSGTVALMLSGDSYQSPATVKARLMRSSRKVDVEPTLAGAGVLDIEGALAETGVMYTEALSPRMVRAEKNNAILVQDTAKLWGDTTWGAGYLWTDETLSSNGYLWTDGTLSSNGYLWTDGTISSNGYLWTDGNLWANGYLWTDSELWSSGFLWTDTVQNVNPLFTYGAMDAVLNDD